MTTRTYTVTHYHSNPRNNVAVRCSTLTDARRELRRMVGEGGVSILTRDGVEVARRRWRRESTRV